MSVGSLVVAVGDAAMLEAVERESILLGDDATRMASVMKRCHELDSALRVSGSAIHLDGRGVGCLPARPGAGDAKEPSVLPVLPRVTQTKEGALCPVEKRAPQARVLGVA